MIQQAYDLKNVVFTTGGQSVSANGAGETIAIIDAFADPNISSDLQTFDANFGISNDNASGQFALTVATPEGAVSTNAGWALEESLDVEWAHAIAPAASILLVEASSAQVSALTSAVTWAASQPGVVAVSMSWGDSPEFAGETADDKDFTTPASHPGVTFVAAAGDNADPNYPSTSPNVLAVGGTTLTVDSSGNWISESPWDDGGGGTSPFEGTNKPEVSYDANPSTGFLVFDSTRDQGKSGWQVVGGTSAGTPQWAAIIALVDQGRSLIGLGSLDGPTQTLPEIKSLPSSDFNQITGTGLTGEGSPIGEKVISALVGGNITSVHDIATHLVFSQQPTNRTAGADFSPAITVFLEDADGSIVSADDSNVTLSINSGPGTLTGTATVSAVNGIATFSNLALDTAGTYTLQATDGNIAGATSNSITVSPAAASQLIVDQQPTTVTAESAIAPAVTVDIEDQFGNLVTTNTSTITLAVNTGLGSLSGTTAAAASGGIATFGNLSLDTAGTYTLKATDGNLTSATTNAFTVNPLASTTSLAASSDSLTAGQVVAFTATVTAENGSPTGTVTFMDGSIPVGTAPINSTTHQATAFTDSLPSGSNDITATYNGSGEFATSSTSLTESVSASVATTITLATSSDSILAGLVIAFTAKVTAATGSPTGIVTFMDDSTLIGTAVINATTHEAIGFTLSLPVGFNDITATFSSSAGFSASSTSLVQIINPGTPTTTSLIASSNPVTAGQVIAFTATVTSASGSPTGTVTFMDGAIPIGTAAINPDTHQAIAFALSLPAGSNIITAAYNGGPGFAASSAALAEAVNAPTTTTLAASSNSTTSGQVIAFTATVAADGASPTGTVTFMDGSLPIGTAPIDPITGQAIAFTDSLPTGSNKITATYNGAAGFAASTGLLTETVSPGAATSIGLVASSNQILAGEVVAFTATVSAVSGSPLGTVTFTDGAMLIGTVALDAQTHQATAFALSLPQGSNNIMAIYDGAGFATSSTSLTESVTPA
jgi:hypothetical protein